MPHVLALWVLLTCFAVPTAGSEFSTEPILPLPPAPTLDVDKISLGETLFHDARVSRDNALACANCHNLSRGGDAGVALATGFGGQRDVVNSPTIFNVGLNAWITWRGAFRTLEEHTDAEIQNPIHANMTWPELVAKLSDIPQYESRFRKIYGRPISRDDIINALTTYERSLVTPNGRFDRFLRGESGAITEEERHGYALFKTYGCIACHQGVNVGGNLFQRIGVFKNFFRQSPLRPADLGRFNVTKRDQDRHVFRVPSLRNVAVTAPYFHDGSALTLSEAIATMGRVQLDREIPPKDIAAIAAFLGTLTGEYNGWRVADEAGPP